MSDTQLCHRSNIYSMRDLIRHYEFKVGGHWFDKETMRFFKTRLTETLACDKDTILFVTSECGPNCIRRASIRSYTPDTGAIATIGEFQAYKSTTYALKAAREMVARGEL